jgi:hypothetical protein
VSSASWDLNFCMGYWNREILNFKIAKVLGIVQLVDLTWQAYWEHTVDKSQDWAMKVGIKTYI